MPEKESVAARLGGLRRPGSSAKPIRVSDIRREGWYFKDLPQTVADTILRKQGPGSFMVRQLGSTAIKLSLVTMRAIKHLDIETMEKEGKVYYRIGRGSLFATIQQLIDHYKKSPGLGITLDKYPSKKTVDELWQFSISEVTATQPFDLRLPWDVQFATWKKKDIIVHQCRSVFSDDQKELFSRHSKILMAVNHENITSLLGCSVESPRSFIVTESLGEGSLIDYLHRNTMSLLLRPNDLLNIASDICKGMLYLENKNIVHNELVAENCVINELCQVKITGFHLSRYEGDYESLVIPHYLYKVKMPPPEFYNNEFSCRSDVWTFGFLLWTVMKRGQDESFDIERILHSDWGTRLPPAIIERVRQIIASCLIDVPAHRPNFKEILPYLHEQDFPGPPYRFRDYSSEENTSVSANGDSSQEDEPRAKIVVTPTNKKAKFPSMSNLTETANERPTPPPRDASTKTSIPESSPKKPAKRPQSAMNAPIWRDDDNPVYSKLNPGVGAQAEAIKMSTTANPHRQMSAAPHIAAAALAAAAATENQANDNQGNASSVTNNVASSIQSPQEAAPQSSRSVTPVKPARVKSPQPGPETPSTGVNIVPAGKQKIAPMVPNKGRFGFDRSTPKPEARDAIGGQENAITGSAINPNEEDFTFMEYDMSVTSNGNRSANLDSVSEELVQDEDIMTLKEMLDYASQRITFSEQNKADAQKEKNAILGEISRAELKCMNDVEELSRMFFKRIQKLQTEIIENSDGSANLTTTDQDMKIKRFNEMKFRGRLAMRQLKKELQTAWSQNRDMMGKIALLSHSDQPSQPLHSKDGKIINVAESHDTSPLDQSVNKSDTEQKGHPNRSNLTSPVSESKSLLPESQTPVHVLQFLSKFIESPSTNTLDKEQVKFLFKALDQAYSDSNRLQQTIKSIEQGTNHAANRLNVSVEEGSISEYKERIAQLQTNVKSLSEENTQLRNKVETLQKVVDHANKVVEITKKKVIERDQLEQECHSLTRKLSRLEAQMNDNDKSFRRTLVNLKHELTEALEGKRHFEKQIHALLQQQNEGGGGGADGRGMMARLDQLEKERLEAETRAQVLAENMKAMTSRMESQEVQLYQDKTTIDQLRHEIDQLRKQTQVEHQPQYQSLLQQCQNLDEKLKTAQNRISEIVCERDQFKFLYELTLQKLKAQDEKSSAKMTSKEKKLAKMAAAAAASEHQPKKTSALGLLEKKLLHKSSNSAANNSFGSAPVVATNPPPHQSPYVYNNAVCTDSASSDKNSSLTSTVSSNTGHLPQRQKLVSPRIATSPRTPCPPPPAAAHENVTPITPGKLKGKWHAF